jgi:hypothetical protein
MRHCTASTGRRPLQLLLGALLLGAACSARAADAPPPSGLDVMRAVDARPRGRDQIAHAVWHLIEASGSERVRETRNYWRDAHGKNGIHAQRLIVFESPPDVKDTAFLVWTAEDPSGQDQQWLYLPALRKVRRIATGDRGNSFVGTDFVYDDLVERTAAADDHSWLRREEQDAHPCDVIESRPRTASPYSRRVQWIDVATRITRRIDYYARSGELEKTLTAAWEQVDGIWVWKRLEMRNLQSGHRTVVEIDGTRLNSGLDEDVFTENSLRLGAP